MKMTNKPQWQVVENAGREIWRCDIELACETGDRRKVIYEVGPAAGGIFSAARAASIGELANVVARICATRLVAAPVGLLGKAEDREELLKLVEEDWEAMADGMELPATPRPKVLVVTQCTGRKVGSPAPAERLYEGRRHLELMAGVDLARTAGIEVKVVIVSAKHGLVDGADEIEPYDQTFAGAGDVANRQAGELLAISAGLKAQLGAAGWDLIIVGLGRDYLVAAGADQLLIEPSAPTLSLTSRAAQAQIGNWIAPAATLVLGGDDLADFGAAHVNVKGTAAACALRSLGRRGLEATLSAMKEGPVELKRYILENGRA